MLAKIWDFITNHTLLLIIIASLLLLGNAIDILVPFEWLKYLFVIVQKTSLILDFMIDIPTLWLAFGISLTLEGSFWGLKGILFITSWYRNNVAR